MQVYERIGDIANYIKALKINGLRIGFIPTMGALHKGHASLVERSVAENNITVCSIFVNPIQFNDKKDYERYPKMLKEDLELLRTAGCQAVFTPTVEEVYPDGVDSRIFDFGAIGNVMEGTHRPGHFNGVAVVVNRLFDIINPHCAYFGEKDYQQLIIVKELVRMVRSSVEIVGCPTLREQDGLAMSSRNMLLTDEERRIAPHIYQTLVEAKKRTSSMPVKTLKNWVVGRISTEPRITVEYFEIGDSATLQPLENWNQTIPCRGFVAARIGSVRLIDNIELIP